MISQYQDIHSMLDLSVNMNDISLNQGKNLSTGIASRSPVKARNRQNLLQLEADPASSKIRRKSVFSSE